MQHESWTCNRTSHHGLAATDILLQDSLPVICTQFYTSGQLTRIIVCTQLPSRRFCSALFDIWLRADTPVTGAREQWATSLQQMMNVTSAK
jgi:hypothetical protein